MKQPQDCKNEIKNVLEAGRNLISDAEYDFAMNSDDWDAIQKILDKAQGALLEHNESDYLKQAREEKTLFRKDFTDEELQKLEHFSPEEYKLLK